MTDGVILYGPPAACKTTVCHELERIGRQYREFPAQSRAYRRLPHHQCRGPRHVIEATRLDLDAGFTLVDICKAAGLVRPVSTFGNPAILLTPAGLAHVQERRRRRDDPASRTVAACNGLLRWMYHQHAAEVRMPIPDRFATTPEANFEGRPFTDAEIRRAAEYLAQRELIKGPGAFGHIGPVRADITPDGMDCVVDWSADVSAYLRDQQTATTTSTYNGPVFHGDANEAQLAWNNNSVAQNKTRIEQVASGYEALAKAMTEVMSLVPAMNLAPEGHEDVEAASNEVVAEIVRDEPRPGPIRRALAVLRSWFTPIAAATASGAALGASDGAREAAHHAIELISSF